MKCNKLILEALGHIDTTAYSLHKEGLKDYQVLNINGAIKSLEPIRMYGLPTPSKQALVNTFYQSRDLSKVKGNVTTKTDIEYFGFTNMMSPVEYLRLAAKRGSSLFDRPKAKDFAKNFQKELAEDKKPRLGASTIWLKETDGKLVVNGHEGRHRANMIYEMFGGDVDIPVDFQVRNIRTHDLNEKYLDLEIVNEDGRALGKTLRELRSQTKDMK